MHYNHDHLIKDCGHPRLDLSVDVPLTSKCSNMALSTFLPSMWKLSTQLAAYASG